MGWGDVLQCMPGKRKKDSCQFLELRNSLPNYGPTTVAHERHPFLSFSLNALPFIFLMLYNTTVSYSLCFGKDVILVVLFCFPNFVRVRQEEFRMESDL